MGGVGDRFKGLFNKSNTEKDIKDDEVLGGNKRNSRGGTENNANLGLLPQDRDSDSSD